MSDHPPIRVFSNWLATQRREPDPLGALGRLRQNAEDFPRALSLGIIKAYVAKGGVAPETVDAAYTTWRGLYLRHYGYEAPVYRAGGDDRHHHQKRANRTIA